MKTLTLKKLTINNHVITFNTGMNFIIGYNGTGKTILFNTILYLLGLKKNNRTMNFIKNNVVELECNIAGQNLSFKRNLREEVIIEGDIHEKINAKEINNFYTSLLLPQFNIGHDETAATQIIRASFYSDGELLSKINKDDLKSKIMGINANYLKESRRQIELFKNNLQKDEYSYEILKTYINNVERNLNSVNNNDAELIKGILKKEFFNMYDELFENKKVLDQALEAYENISRQSDLLYSERSSLIDELYNSYLEQLNLRAYSSIISYSGSERRLIEFLNLFIRTVKHTDLSFLNSIGLLVADCPFDHVDSSRLNEIRKMIDRETKQQKLQYIEFCYKDDSIPSEWIICDLRNKGALNWLKVD